MAFTMEDGVRRRKTDMGPEEVPIIVESISHTGGAQGMKNIDLTDTFGNNAIGFASYLMSLLGTMGQYMLWFILLSMGWHKLADSELARVKNPKQAVFVFAHTSYWDFWLIAIHGLIFPELMDHVYTVMQPQPFNSWYGKYLRMWNFIPATRAEDAGNGFVKETVDLFKKKDRAFLMLSPEGRILQTKWRSGYYHIAKELDIPIIVVGFDYEIRSLVANKFRTHQEYQTKEKMEEILMNDMATVIPLHPHQSHVKITKAHNPVNVMAYDPIMISNVITAIFSFWYLFNFNGLLFIHAVISACASLKYHYGVEKDIMCAQIDFWGNVTFIIHELAVLLNMGMLTTDPFWIATILIAVYSYHAGSGRQHRGNGERYSEYMFNHTLFHISAGLAVIYPLMGSP